MSDKRPLQIKGRYFGFLKLNCGCIRFYLGGEPGPTMRSRPTAVLAWAICLCGGKRFYYGANPIF